MVSEAEMSRNKPYRGLTDTVVSEAEMSRNKPYSGLTDTVVSEAIAALPGQQWGVLLLQLWISLNQLQDVALKGSWLLQVVLRDTEVYKSGREKLSGKKQHHPTDIKMNLYIYIFNRDG